jgi:hypothetical protein
VAFEPDLHKINEEKVLDDSLRKIIKEVGIPLKTVARSLDISLQECWGWWIRTAPVPRRSKLMNLKKEWGVSLEDLEKGVFNTLLIKKIVFGTSNSLPEKYSENPLSFVSSSRHIMEVIRLQHGAHVGNKMLMDFDINPNYFDDLKNPISLRFFDDILEFFLKLGHQPADFDWLSKALYLTVEETQLKQYFPECETYEEAYEHIKKSTDQFDKNFWYHFSFIKDGVSIFCKPSDQLKETFKDAPHGSLNLYKYRSFLFGNMASLCGLDPLPVKVRSCVSEGDSHCHYEITFPKKKFTLLRNL